MGIGWLVDAFVVKSILGSNPMAMAFEGAITIHKVVILTHVGFKIPAKSIASAQSSRLLLPW